MARKIDENTRDMVRQLRAKGIPFRKIANQLGISVGTAHNLSKDEISPQETTSNDEIFNNSPTSNNETHHPEIPAKPKTTSSDDKEYTNQPSWYKNYNIKFGVTNISDISRQYRELQQLKQTGWDQYRPEYRFIEERPKIIQNDGTPQYANPQESHDQAHIQSLHQRADRLEAYNMRRSKQQQQQNSVQPILNEREHKTCNIDHCEVVKQEKIANPQESHDQAHIQSLHQRADRLEAYNMRRSKQQQQQNSVQPILNEREHKTLYMDHCGKVKQEGTSKIPEKIVSIDKRDDPETKRLLVKKSEDKLELSVESEDKFDYTDFFCWGLIGLQAFFTSYMETRRNIPMKVKLKPIKKKKVRKAIPIAIPIAKVVETRKPVNNEPIKIILKPSNEEPSKAIPVAKEAKESKPDTKKDIKND